MSITEIKKMSIQERLTTMEQLWDSLCHEEVEPDSPRWHENVLSNREKIMDSADAKYLTIEQLRERYPGTRGSALAFMVTEAVAKPRDPSGIHQ